MIDRVFELFIQAALSDQTQQIIENIANRDKGLSRSNIQLILVISACIVSLWQLISSKLVSTKLNQIFKESIKRFDIYAGHYEIVSEPSETQRVKKKLSKQVDELNKSLQDIVLQPVNQSKHRVKKSKTFRQNK